MTDIDALAQIADDARGTYELYRDERKTAELREHDAYAAWCKARIEHGRAKGHPLAGKTVQRKATRLPSFNLWERTTKPKRIVTETGVVTLCDNLRANYRGHTPAPGEWFVLSKSGATAYPLTSEWEAVA